MSNCLFRKEDITLLDQEQVGEFIKGATRKVFRDELTGLKLVTYEKERITLVYEVTNFRDEQPLGPSTPSGVRLTSAWQEPFLNTQRT